MADIPVIFLTADRKGRKRGNKLGAVAYLTKPITAEMLLESVTTHLPA